MLNSPGYDKVGVENPRIERAAALAEQGASPSEIFNQTGLVILANGNITDGFGGEIVWRKNDGRSAGLGDSNRVREQEKRQTAAGDAGSNGGRIHSARDEKVRRSAWNTLDEKQQRRAENAVRSCLEENGLADEIGWLIGEDKDSRSFTERLYSNYRQGDVVFKQWVEILGDSDGLISALGEISEEAAAQASETGKRPCVAGF